MKAPRQKRYMLRRGLRTTKPSVAKIMPSRHGKVVAHSASAIETAEFRLAAACCRWPPSEARNAVIRTTATGVTDWNHFLWLARRHRIDGLVREALASAEIELPSAVSAKLAARAERIAQRNAFLLTGTLHLQRALDAAKIPCLMLKGVTLAQLAYGSFKTKHARDIDLLVPPAFAPAALHVLEREGYALSYPAAQLDEAQRHAVFRYAREVQLRHHDKRLLVEMHWRPTNNPLLLQGIDAYAATQNVPLLDGGVRTLAHEDLFAYLCVHGAQHAWSRLKWLADLNALLSASTVNLQQLYRYAESIGAGRCAGQALLLCNRLFSLSIPAMIKDEIVRDQIVERLERIAVEAMSDDYAEAESGRSFISALHVLFAQFLLGKGGAFLAAQFGVESVRTLDVVEFPLPRALQFLYPFLRLPLWLWRGAKSVAAAGRVRAHGSKP